MIAFRNYNTSVSSLFYGIVITLIFTAAHFTAWSAQSIQGFMPNHGQFIDYEGHPHKKAEYALYGAGKVRMIFHKDRIVYLFHQRKIVHNDSTRKLLELGRVTRANDMATQVRFNRMDVVLKNANPEVEITHDNPSASHVDFYNAACPEGILGVKAYKTITYHNIYPHIDLKFYLSKGRVKYDFIVHPGGDPDDIQLKYVGADNVELAKEKITARTELGRITEGQPYVYQRGEEAGDQRVIPSGYSKTGEKQFTFSIDEYQKDKDLIIDPTLYWATYFDTTGGASSTWFGADTDGSGNYFAVGYTYDDVSTWPAITPGGSNDYSGTGITNLTLVKFSNAGELLWTIFYGGNDGEYVRDGLACDSNGDVYVGAYTWGSDDVPTLNPGGSAYYDGTNNANANNGIILKFQNDGTRLWATYYGSPTNDASAEIKGVTVDTSDRLVVAGETYANDVPTVDLGGSAYYQPSPASTPDQFITRFNTNLSINWSTYFGGNGSDWSIHVTADPTDGGLFFKGNSYVNNNSEMPPLVDPGGSAYYVDTAQGNDNFYYKFAEDGEYIWGTSLSGNDNDNTDDMGHDLIVDANGNLFSTFKTQSTNMDTKDPGGGAYYQSTKRATTGPDGYIVKFTPNFALPWATYYGGTSGERTWGMSVSANGCADLIYIALLTGGGGHTTVDPGSSFYDGSYNGGSTDGIFGSFDTSGVLNWMTYYGEGGSFYPRQINLTEDGAEAFFAALGSDSGTNILNNPGNPARYIAPEGSDGFGRWDLPSQSSVSGASASPNPICAGNSTTLSVSGSLGTGSSWNWYSGSCGGTFEGTGSSISVSPSSTTTYYVRAEGNCNTTSCVSTTVTVNPSSSAPSGASASPSSICPGNSSTLTVSGGSLGTNASWEWYSGSCGGTFEGTGSSISVSPSSTTTYFVRAEGDCDTTSCASVTVTLKTTSSAPSGINASPDTVCSGNNTTLSVSGGGLGTGADWNWYSGSCGGTFEGTGTSIVVSPSSNTTYYVRAEGDCNTTGCASKTIVVQTVPGMPPALSGPDSVCANATGITFTTSSVAGATSYDWTVPTGANITSGQGTTTITVDFDTSSGNVCVRASNNCGNSSYNCKNVFVSNPPATPTQPSGTDTVCAGETGVVFTTNPVTGATNYNWTVPTGATIVSGQGSTSITVDFGSTSGNVCVRAEKNCGSSSYSCLAVTVKGAPAIPNTPSGPDTLCPNATGLTYSVPSVSGANNYTWTVPGGATIVSGQGTNSVTVDWGANNGNICVEANNECDTSSAACLSVIVPPGLGTSFNTTNVSCNDGSDGQIDLSVSGGATPYDYNWSNGDSTQDLSGLAAGTYYVTITDDQNCYTKVDTVNVFEPDAILSQINVTDVSCSGNMDGALDLTVSGGTLPYTYAWSNGDSTQDISNLATGTYVVTIFDGNGCQMLDSATIQVGQLIADAGPDTAICEGEQLQLNATGGNSYTWTPGSSLSDSTIADPVATPGQTTTYVVTASSGGCSDKDTITVAVNAAPVVDAQPPDTTIQSGALVILKASGGDSYLWQPGGSLSDSTVATPVASPEDSTEYVVWVTGDQGCITTDTVHIFVEPEERELYIPNAFSPNGDGKNDVWRVYGSVRDIHIFIYDRWGEKVYESRDITEGWDGTFEDEMVHSAVFIYYVKATLMNGEEKIFRGNISLLR